MNVFQAIARCILLSCTIAFVYGHGHSPRFRDDKARSGHDSILDIQIAVTSIGRLKHYDGDVMIFQNQLSSSDFFFTPFPFVMANMTECNYNPFNGYSELTLYVSLYSTDLLKAVEMYVKQKYDTICNTKHCEIALLPMHSIRIFKKGIHINRSNENYEVDEEWQSNTQLRQVIEFTIYTSSMPVCESLKTSIVSRCSLSNFELQYSLSNKKTVARSVEVTSEHITNTSMYNKINSQLPMNTHNTIALTGHDYRNLLSETMDQIKMNIRIEEGYDGLQNFGEINQLLDQQLRFKHVELTMINDHLWESLYWTPELTRPDRLAKYLNKIIKQETNDSDLFRFNYTQADEALKENLKLDDKQKLDNLEKQIKSNSATKSSDVDEPSNFQMDDISSENKPLSLQLYAANTLDNQDVRTKSKLNDGEIQYFIVTERFNNTNNEKQNGSTILLRTQDMKKLVSYLSEHVELEGEVIKPKPINATLIKIGSLSVKTRLFSNVVYVKTRLNKHALPLRCPQQWIHRSLTTDNEKEQSLSLSESINGKYDELLTMINNLTNLVKIQNKYSVNSVHNLTDAVKKLDEGLSTDSKNNIESNPTLNEKDLKSLSKVLTKIWTKKSNETQMSTEMSLNRTVNNLYAKLEKILRESANHTATLINEMLKEHDGNMKTESKANNQIIMSMINNTSNDLQQNLKLHVNQKLASMSDIVGNQPSNYDPFKLYNSFGLINKYGLDKLMSGTSHMISTVGNVIESILVVQLNPLKIKVSLHDGVWFEGMVCDDYFEANSASTACRSLGFNNSASFTTTTWEQDGSCAFGWHLTSFNSRCQFILNVFRCSSNTFSSLASCNIDSIFNHDCGNGEHVNLVCS